MWPSCEAVLVQHLEQLLLECICSSSPSYSVIWITATNLGHFQLSFYKLGATQSRRLQCGIKMKLDTVNVAISIFLISQPYQRRQRFSHFLKRMYQLISMVNSAQKMDVSLVMTKCFSFFNPLLSIKPLRMWSGNSKASKVMIYVAYSSVIKEWSFTLFIFASRWDKSCP